MTDSNNSTERCVLCLDQKRSPVRIQCGHTFCFGCLNVYKSYKKYPWANKCPICRSELKEKRTTKRKYSEMNEEPATTTTNSRTLIENNSELTTNQSVSSQQIIILEEFMALAADYDYSEETENSVHDLTQDEGADEHTDFEDNGYDDFYTDSNDNDNDDDDYDDDDDDNDNYYYFGNEEEYNSPTLSGAHLENSYGQDDDEVEIINDDVPYYDSIMPRVWSSNTVNLVNSDVDWETLIANEVLIID